MKKVIIIAIVFGILGFLIGYGLGFLNAIELCARLAVEFTDIKVDPEIMKQVIIKYGGSF